MQKDVLQAAAGELAGYLLNSLLHLNLDIADISKVLSVSTVSASAQKEETRRDILGFYAEWWPKDNSSYEAMVKTSEVVGTIAPFWATVQGDGTLTDRGGNNHLAVVKYAKSKGITTLLLVNNAKQSKPKTGIHAVLANKALRDKGNRQD